MSLGKEHLADFDRRHPIRRVLVTLSPLVLHHVALSVHPFRRHRLEQIPHAIRFKEQRELQRVRRRIDVVVGPIGLGRSIVSCARGLEQRVEFPFLHVLRAFEHQVLEQVREAGPAGFLTGRSNVVPDVHGNQRHGMVLVQDHVQAVRQRELRKRNGQACGARCLWRRALNRRCRRRTRHLASRCLRVYRRRSFLARQRQRNQQRSDEETRQDHTVPLTFLILYQAVFSSRAPGTLEPNHLTRVLRRLREGGVPLLDLTVTNPTDVGIEYPSSILDALADRRSLRYDPVPLGMLDAREAIARDCARNGIKVAAERVVLTSSTSEAYSVLFKLLCAPAGDAVMVPAPSYPLFEHLTDLDGIHSVPYRLEFHRRWAIDFDTLDHAWSDSVRAVLAVTPNNPTGSIVTGCETMELAARCAKRDAALILDEVFIDYPLSGDLPPVKRIDECLTFRLGGLSKSAGLPQLKLGWIIVDGPEPQVRGALDRLELICDTYLSVSTPVQHAAPALIAAGASVRARILERIRTNDR